MVYFFFNVQSSSLSYSCFINFFISAAKSLQSCPTLCDPTDSSPPGSPVPGILQARTLEFFLQVPSPRHQSEKWKWSRSVVPDSSRPHGLQPMGSMWFSRQEYCSGVLLPSPFLSLIHLKSPSNLKVLSSCWSLCFICMTST